MSEMKKFEVAVVGAGPGGYVAAIQAAQLGKSVALIDKGFLGGCCLNVGCIPTKALLSHANALHTIREASEWGIETGPIKLHYAKMKGRKDAVVQKVRTSLEGLLKSNKITIYQGSAQFEAPHRLKVQGQDNLWIEADKIILATGSVPLDIPAFPCDHKKILNSTSLLEITELPKKLAIVGGGYIGCEFATLFKELGVEVVILEALPSILSLQGATVSQFMTQSFKQRGIELRTGVKVLKIDAAGPGVELHLEGGETVKADLALIAVGRKIYTEGLHLEKAGLKVNGRGALETKETMETEVPGIYAIGDLTGKWMLAHVASHQGIVAARHAAGQEVSMHYDAVPAVVFTSPEIGTVGLTAEMAKERGFQPTVGTFPFAALGKGQASRETEGFAQIVSDAKTGQILGAIVIGHEASNLIAQMTLAIQQELTLESVIETIHAHPTLAESWHEAALMGMGTPLHLPPKVKK